MPKRLLRLSSFFIKEIVDVLQQPRLVATLILGPFLILMLFGLGFTGAQQPVEAIMVVPPNLELPEDLIQQTERFRLFLPIREITHSKDDALGMLEAGEVDLVAVLPTETYSALLSGRQIVIELLINEINPLRANYVAYVSNFFVTELNKEILARAAELAKQLAPRLQQFSAEMLDDLILLGEQVEGGDLEGARAHLEEILKETAYETGSLESSSQMLLGVGAVLATLGAPAEELERLQRVYTSVQELRDGLVEIKQALDREGIDVAANIEQLRDLRNTMVDLQAAADLLEKIPTDVLIAPLTMTVDNVSRFEADYLGFYAPAVLTLLLQHMAVTFSSLSLVRERLLGAEEVFRVAPISPWEIITGKYMSYSLLTLTIAGTLTLLIVLMRVPFFGSPFYFFLVLILLTAASLGWGFFISLFSQRESQSVQLSMLLLIASVFFSGFFLPLFGLQRAVRVVSYALPVTYGIQALQGIMLAGRDPAWSHLAALASLGLGFYILCTLIYTWQHKRE
jgi:ABC-2 type transport system permease protein